jgi:HlyD family secretion protein
VKENEMKRRTIIIIVVGALILAGSVYGIVSAQQRNQAGASDLQTYRVVKGDLDAAVDETGKVHADQSALLYWEASGIVGEIEVKLGDQVKADQVLASIREDSLPQSYYLSQQELINATRALEDLYETSAEVAAQAQSAVAAARDVLDDAEYRWTINQPGNRASDEELKAAKARLQIAEKQLESKQKRYDNASGKINRAQAQLLLTDAINAYQQAEWYYNWLQEGADEIEMAVLDANLAVAQANLEAAEREYERVKDGPDADDVMIAEARIAAAQSVVDSSQITAPFDGVITEVNVLPGDLVAPNTLAFRMDNLNNLLVDVGVSEVDINQINAGQPVILEFDAIPNTEYEGEVIEVSPVGVQQQGLVSFEVTIKIIDPDQQVLPGLTAAVQIIVRQVEDTILIPNRSVRWVQGQQVVYIARDENKITENNLERVLVTLGASSDEFSELVEGDISLGDLIILNPPSVSIFDEVEPGDGPPEAFR